MAVSEIKLRLLYIMKILLEKTDEEHIMTAAEIDGELSRYGMSADRKTVYSDVETLQAFGLDILQKKGKNSGYYMGGRDFELPELKLLVDAVQSSKFITVKKSEQLIEKLEKLTSKNNAKQLHRNVFIYNRPKAENETIFYNVDHIYTAQLENKKISFQYTEWTVQKELCPKRAGKRYVVSPWSLTWDDENYYLIAYNEETDDIRHYRVDKMKQIAIEEEVRLGKGAFKDFDLATFAKKTFGMYGGQDEEVTLLCHNSLVGVILDRFGKEVNLMPKGAEHFQVKVLVSVSPQFFGWLTGVGERIEIVKPESAREKYKEHLLNVMGKY